MLVEGDLGMWRGKQMITWLRSTWTKVEVFGKVGKGRGRKTWLQCVNSDMKDLGLRVEEAQDRQLWIRKIFGETSEPCVHGKNRR